MHANKHLLALLTTVVALGACAADQEGGGETGSDETGPGETSPEDPGLTTAPTTDPSTTTSSDPPGSTGTTDDPETTGEAETSDGSSGEDDTSGDSTGEAACVQFAIDEIVFDHVTSGVTFIFERPDVLGDPEVSDQLFVQFFADEEGTFDLAAGANDNYATCSQCLLMYEDITEVSHGAHFFQAEGTITVDEESDIFGEPHTLSASVSGVRLIEVEIGDDFQSIPIEGGGCIEIMDGSFGTAP
jgi:hypothetical protein